MQRTYSTLIGSGAKGKCSRLQQVIDWVGGPSFDGCIVLDECHKAKNFVPGKEGQSTKVRCGEVSAGEWCSILRVLMCLPPHATAKSDVPSPPASPLQPSLM